METPEARYTKYQEKLTKKIEEAKASLDDLKQFEFLTEKVIENCRRIKREYKNPPRIRQIAHSDEVGYFEFQGNDPVHAKINEVGDYLGIPDVRSSYLSDLRRLIRERRMKEDLYTYLLKTPLIKLVNLCKDTNTNKHCRTPDQKRRVTLALKKENPLVTYLINSFISRGYIKPDQN